MLFYYFWLQTFVWNQYGYSLLIGAVLIAKFPYKLSLFYKSSRNQITGEYNIYKNCGYVQRSCPNDQNGGDITGMAGNSQNTRSIEFSGMGYCPAGGFHSYLFKSDELFCTIPASSKKKQQGGYSEEDYLDYTHIAVPVEYWLRPHRRGKHNYGHQRQYCDNIEKEPVKTIQRSSPFIQIFRY